MAQHPRLRRGLLGDWGLFVRDPLDLLRLSFLIGAIVALTQADFDAGARLALTFLFLVGARAVQLPRPFDLLLLVGMALQGFGNAANLFITVGWWDQLVHFVLPSAIAPAVYVLLVRLDTVPDLGEEAHRHHQLGLFIIAFAIGVAIGSFYEMYEWLANHAFGATLEVGYNDTIGDLLDNAVGSAAGAGLLVLWATRGWGTTRRVPARHIRG